MSTTNSSAVIRYKAINSRKKYVHNNVIKYLISNLRIDSFPIGLYSIGIPYAAVSTMCLSHASLLQAHPNTY